LGRSATSASPASATTADQRYRGEHSPERQATSAKQHADVDLHHDVGFTADELKRQLTGDEGTDKPSADTIVSV
jgi:hypothetical protein